MKKNIIVTTTVIIITLISSFSIGNGFKKRTDVVLSDYSVLDNGTKLTFSTNITSSMGYTRGFKDMGGKEKPHYLTFYSTFGGLNTSLGARNKFVLELDEDDMEIYFNRNNGGYELVLQKDIETGEWIRP